MPPQQPWQRALIILAAVVSTGAVTLSLYFGRTVFIPIALAIFLSYVLTPVVVRLDKLKVPRGPGVILTMAVVVGLGLGLIALVGNQLSGLATELPKHRAKIVSRVTEVRQKVLGRGNPQLTEMAEDVSKVLKPETETPAAGGPQRVILEPTENSLLNQMDTYLSPVAQAAGQTAFTFILTVFILLKREDLRNRFLRLVGSGRVTLATKAVDDASRRVSKYLFAQLLLNVAFGILIVFGLWCIGVEYAVLWGVVATVMRYVPYIGTWLGVIPPTLLSLATGENGWEPLAVIGLFLTLELISNNFIEPRLYGKSLGVSEVAQLVAAAFWSFLWGPIGLILSQPLTTCLLVLGKYIAALKFLDVLFGDEPALEKTVAFYQRLAARDQDEAVQLAEVELKAGKTPVEVFDAFFTPSLSTARIDRDNGELTEGEVVEMLRVLVVVGEMTAEADPAQLPVPEGTTRVRVLAVPAKDAFDRAGAELFGQTLDERRWDYRMVPTDTLTGETLAEVEKFNPTVVVLSSVPAGGVTHAKFLIKRLRAKFPALKIAVGRWGGGADYAAVREQLLAAGADRVDATMADAVTDLNGWQSVLANRETPAAGTNPALIKA